MTTLHLTTLPPLPRYVPMFGDLDYDPSMAYASVALEEQLEDRWRRERF